VWNSAETFAVAAVTAALLASPLNGAPHVFSVAKETNTMAIKEDARTRSPRGTKNVTQAFFEALDGIPVSQQKAVATAALSSIRDDLKAQRLKTKDAAAKAKAKAPAKKKAPATRVAKAVKAAKPSPKAPRKQVAAKKVPAKKAAPAKTAKRTSPRKIVSPTPAPEAATE
jgi:hypothetical protein